MLILYPTWNKEPEGMLKEIAFEEGREENYERETNHESLQSFGTEDVCEKPASENIIC